MKKRASARPISLTLLCKLGTIAHNRPFSPRDFREYTGGSQAHFASLVNRGVIERTGRGTYYPTSKGWRVIERSCKLRR